MQNIDAYNFILIQLTSEEPIASGQITMETREKSSAQTKKEDPKNQGDWHYHLGGMRHARWVNPWVFWSILLRIYLCTFCDVYTGLH